MFSSKRQAITWHCHNILLVQLKNTSSSWMPPCYISFEKRNSHSHAQGEEPCSWKSMTYSTRDMLVLSSHGHRKPWWSFKEGLPFYWGIRDLCGAYSWGQQTSNEFWSYSSLGRTWCLSKPRILHRKKKRMNASLARYLSTNPKMETI